MRSYLQEQKWLEDHHQIPPQEPLHSLQAAQQIEHPFQATFPVSAFFRQFDWSPHLPSGLADLRVIRSETDP